MAVRSSRGRWRFLWVVVLVCTSVAGVVGATKKCEEFKSGKEIMGFVENAHVLVQVDKEFSSNDGKDYDDFCKAYERTIEERKEGLEVGRIYGDKFTKVANKLDAINEDEWPKYVLLKRGTTVADLPTAAIPYTGESKSVNDIIDFLTKEIDMRIGNLVYSIDAMDALASWFMAIQNGNDDDNYANLKKKVIVYTAKLFALLPRKSFQKDNHQIDTLYVKAFDKITEFGPAYVSKHHSRIQKLLEKEDNTLSPIERDELNQKMHILNKFMEPKKIQFEEHRRFCITIGINFLLLLGFFAMVGYELFCWLAQGQTKRGNEETEESAADLANKENSLD
uniref:Endoplasmic reticulum resident protein 29 C-terminal domain-containing protein n=1 Tax=Attheya septentrionalis TaxID=420275 RepID=A0A7S2UIM3_9STRA|mmetsp:Transcript_24752/g.44839  ORF Transcript_24752/g.44839 Transcript_24752/m.44839 type:complete len:336 (+) Transcript_24752:40-1047(+)|eukprot:CAMPEP_0198302890 /NCGR_PEP_ID=MMETSP1449-20131203/56601_1 /TAXON_ID=420275 /ORGANISM="Attheya septentrionalis, Strain CCMP2084" /LENGTH=335 /DNA_ID=CAMNT_0044005365 /DNA_START=46 /DNA_END=1053 /DNA_ORIENTATION=+